MMNVLKIRLVIRINFNEKNNINFFFAFTNTEAATISDYEIESLIKDYLILIQVNNNTKKNIRFSIILDDNPNAFINEKKILFISTGLLKYIPTYEALIGVLAHELGHLENFHITKRIESIKSLKSFHNFSTLSVIAASLLANNSDYLLQSMVTNQVNIQNYYSSFSREQEREADIYAAQTLNHLRISSIPLKKFLKILEKKSFQKGLNEDNFKFSSHPVYKERFDILENISIKQKHVYYSDLSNRFNFIKAKLFGFTENNNDKLYEHLNNDYYNYANSIIISRNGKLKDSLIILNKLINKYPTNFYLLETKADLLLTHGYSNEAKRFYDIVLQKDNNNHYVKKRIFEIEYEKIDKKNNVINQKFFDNFSDLMIVFQNDNILQKKFKKIAFLVQKYEWIDFIDANILLNNASNDQALEKYKNILINSKDKKLIQFAKQIIKQISNE